jgi:hypothetical protein
VFTVFWSQSSQGGDIFLAQYFIPYSILVTVYTIYLNVPTLHFAHCSSLDKFVPVLNSHQNKRSMRSGGTAPSFSNSALDGGEWSASRPGRLTSKEQASCNLWIAGWADPETVWWQWERQDFLHLPKIETWVLGLPALSWSLSRLSIVYLMTLPL